MDYKTCTKCGESKELSKFSKGRICRKCVSASQAEYRKAWAIKNADKCRAYAKAYYDKNKDNPEFAAKLYYEANKEKTAAYNAAWHQENKERRAEVDKVRRLEKRDEIAEKSYEYRQQNKEKIAVVALAWKRANKAKVVSYTVKYNATKLRATPQWASDAKILSFYESSDALNMLTGEWHHVDHIVPLQSDLVCGLHCEANLQIMPALENQRKGNRWWPDMW